MSGDNFETTAMIVAPANLICSDMIFKDAQGELTRGERNCEGTLAACTSDGETNCKATDDYPVSKKLGLAAKVLAGQTVAGVSGSAALRPADCASDGSIDCVAIANFPAVNKSVNLAAAQLTKISSSVTVGGVTGTMTNCSIDGQTDCLAIPSYPALQKSLLTASVLKNGTVINGVTGAYPNATYPLAGATVTADLTTATFNAQVKASTAFEYFDSTGSLQTGAGDIDITAANIVSGISIFGESGSAPALIAPSAWNVRVGTVVNGVTGQLKTSCRNRANASLWDTGVPYTVTAVDDTTDTLTIAGHPFTSNMTVRVGASTEPTGITVSSTTYYVIVVDANTIRLSASSGPGAQVDITSVGANVTVYQWGDGSNDWWDTIDDRNNFQSYPIAWVGGWTGDTDCNYSTWQDLTADGACDSAADNCIMQDRISGLMWSESYPVSGAAAASTALAWQKAIQYCNDLSFGGFSDWRLATQKELMEAHIHGVRDVGYVGLGGARSLGSTHNNDLFILDVDSIVFWSASAVSYFPTNAWRASLGSGYIADDNKSSAYQVICVR